MNAKPSRRTRVYNTFKRNVSNPGWRVVDYSHVHDAHLISRRLSSRFRGPLSAATRAMFRQPHRPKALTENNPQGSAPALTHRHEAFWIPRRATCWIYDKFVSTVRREPVVETRSTPPDIAVILSVERYYLTRRWYDFTCSSLSRPVRAGFVRVVSAPIGTLRFSSRCSSLRRQAHPGIGVQPWRKQSTRVSVRSRLIRVNACHFLRWIGRARCVYSFAKHPRLDGGTARKPCPLSEVHGHPAALSRSLVVVPVRRRSERDARTVVVIGERI